MGFVPMKLHPFNNTIKEANRRLALELPPVTRPELLPKILNIANRTAGGNRLNILDFPKDFEAHHDTVSYSAAAAERWSSAAANCTERGQAACLAFPNTEHSNLF